MLGDRYIGSDEAIAAGLNLPVEQGKQALDAAGKISDSVNATLAVVGDINSKLAEQELLKQQAQAKPRVGWEAGLANLAASVVELAGQEKERQDRLKMARLELLQKQIERQQEEQMVLATKRLGEITDDFLMRPDSYVGTNTYRDVAIKELSKFPLLKPEDKLSLVKKINEISESRTLAETKKIQEKQERLQQAQADVAEAYLRLRLTRNWAAIKKLGVTDQAQPWIDDVQKQLENFMQEDNGLSEEQKLAIASKVIRQTEEAYQLKADNFVEYNQKIRDFTNYSKEYLKARLEYTTPGNKDYNNLDAFKAKIGLLKIKYGDWGSDVAKPGESEKLYLEQRQRIEQIQELDQKIRQQTGEEFPFSNSAVQGMAALVIASPGYEAKLKSSEFANNPFVKKALELADLYRQYEKDYAETVLARTKINTQITRLKLTEANKYASTATQLIKLEQENKLSPDQQAMLEIIKQASPNAYAALVQMQQKGLTPEQRQQLRQQFITNFELESKNINAIIQTYQQQAEAEDFKLRQKYNELSTYGLLVPRERLYDIAKNSGKVVDEEITRARELYKQRAIEQRAQPIYGMPPGFNLSSAYATIVDEKGLVRVAPRAKLQTITYNGKTIVTPVMRGAYAPVTSGYLANRGNHRHAGADFGVEGTEKTVALVSGTAYIFYDKQGYGGYVDIIGDNGFVYRYAHQQPLVEDGERVSAGEIISMSDGSGKNINGNHLHFEVRRLTPENFDNNGRYVPSFGLTNTVDPIEHLAQLSANASNVRKPRWGVPSFARTHPHLKAQANSVIFDRGVLLNGKVQTVNSAPSEVNKVFNNARPYKTMFESYNIPPDIKYDYNDDYGYAALRQHPNWRRALVDAAKELRVPPWWLADIIQQETGWRVNLDHGGGVYGTFGFQDPRAKNMSFEDQMKLAVQYWKENGWFDVLKRKGNNATIADFWVISRAGTRKIPSLGNKNIRQWIIDGGDPYKVNLNDTGFTFGKELELLGKWTGRKYRIPGRQDLRSERVYRTTAIAQNPDPSCPTCVAMEEAGAWAPHVHEHELA